MARLLVLSVFFMMLYLVGTLMLLSVLRQLMLPAGIFFSGVVMLLGRMGTTQLQVLAALDKGSTEAKMFPVLSKALGMICAVPQHSGRVGASVGSSSGSGAVSGSANSTPDSDSSVSQPVNSAAARSVHITSTAPEPELRY